MWSDWACQGQTGSPGQDGPTSQVEPLARVAISNEPLAVKLPGAWSPVFFKRLPAQVDRSAGKM